MPDEHKTQPVAPEAPVTPVAQPVQQWQAQPPADAQVQYVVAHKSLDGLGGWLMFWLIVFAIAGISYTTSFFTMLGSGASNASDVAYLIFAPLLAAGYIATVVFMAMRKKLAKLLAMATIGLSTLYVIVLTIIDMVNNTSSNLGTAVGGLVTTIIAGGLMILYFVVSKRVKATLVN